MLWDFHSAEVGSQPSRPTLDKRAHQTPGANPSAKSNRRHNRLTHAQILFTGLLMRWLTHALTARAEAYSCAEAYS